MGEQKQHAPTQQKMDSARKEGRVLKSPLFAMALSVTVALLCFVSIVWFTFPELLEVVSHLNSSYFESGDFQSSTSSLLKLLLLYSILPLACGAVFGLGAEAFQVGLKIETEPLRFQMKKFDIVGGGKKIFTGFKNLPEKILYMVILLVGFLIYLSLLVGVIAKSVYAPIDESLSLFRKSLLGAICIGGMLSLSIAAIEYFLRRREYYRDLSMSDDEIRKEFKEQEGDPHLKSARKSMHQEIMFQDLTKRVRESKVILVDRGEK